MGTPPVAIVLHRTPWWRHLWWWFGAQITPRCSTHPWVELRDDRCDLCDSIERLIFEGVERRSWARNIPLPTPPEWRRD